MSTKNKPKLPLVTVIIPVYNVEEYLDRCMESILGQTYENLDIILVNDGSTDGSRGLVVKYTNLDARVRAIHQENKGLSSARNVGIDSAKGEYISFVDSDDYVADDYIQKLYESMVGSDSDLASSSIYNVYGDKSIPSRTRKKRVAPGGIVAGEFLSSTLGNDNRAACGKLFKKSMLKNSNLRFPAGKRHEDIAFLFEAFCLSRRVSFVGEPLYYYVHREGSITTSRVSGVDYDYDMVVVADMIPAIASKYDFVSREVLDRFLVEKRLSYIYTRVRKRSRIAHFSEVRSWLRHSRVDMSSSVLSGRIKVMTTIVILGRLPSIAFFTVVSVVVDLMKRRGLV